MTAKKPAKRASSKKNSQKTPQTMEELLAQTGYELKPVKKGEVVSAIVSQKSGPFLTFDIGGKTQAIVGEKEAEFIQPLVAELKVGDKVSARVILPENREGQTVISLKRAAFDFRWQKMKQAWQNYETLEVRPLEITPGGLIARVENLGNFSGFIPRSFLEPTSGLELSQYLNRPILVKVIEADQENNRLVFSEKVFVDEQKRQLRQAVRAYLNTQKTYPAQVETVTPHALYLKLFLDYDKRKKLPKGLIVENDQIVAEGLVPLNEVSWGVVERLADEFKPGQVIEVKPLGFDEESGRVLASIKVLTENPWESLGKRLKPEDQLEGQIAKVTDYGLFVEIEKGLQGFIPRSKLPPGFEAAMGDKIKVIVEDLKPEEQKLSLTPVLKKKPIGYK